MNTNRAASPCRAVTPVGRDAYGTVWAECRATADRVRVVTDGPRAVAVDLCPAHDVKEPA